MLVLNVRQTDEDKIPDVPTIEERGVLPRLIQTLVQRRQAVKGLMKDKSAAPAKLLQVSAANKRSALELISIYSGISSRRRSSSQPILCTVVWALRVPASMLDRLPPSPLRRAERFSQTPESWRRAFSLM